MWPAALTALFTNALSTAVPFPLVLWMDASCTVVPCAIAWAWSADSSADVNCMPARLVPVVL
jgi:hypothetical protein